MNASYYLNNDIAKSEMDEITAYIMSQEAID